VAEVVEVVVALPAEVTVLVPAASAPGAERAPVWPGVASSEAGSVAAVPIYSDRNLHLQCARRAGASFPTIRD
jgi:hypothetical protein